MSTTSWSVEPENLVTLTRRIPQAAPPRPSVEPGLALRLLAGRIRPAPAYEGPSTPMSPVAALTETGIAAERASRSANRPQMIAPIMTSPHYRRCPSRHYGNGDFASSCPNTAIGPASGAAEAANATSHNGLFAPPPRARRWHRGCVKTGVGKSGAVSTAVEYVIRRAGELTIDEAADIFYARATRLLLDGHAADRGARLRAQRTAIRAGRLSEYEEARRRAASAWRGALPEVRGPWLVVGSALANAAGALVVEEMLDQKDLALLLGPWRQAVGTMVPVGPGDGSRERSQALVR